MANEEKKANFWQNVRAAATMGISDTAKLSNAKEAFDERCKVHEQRCADYRNQIIRTSVKYETLCNALVRAKREIIGSRALGIDDDGNIKTGWYKTGEHRTDTENSGLVASGVGVGVGAGAAIGVPVAAWMLVGAFGTASTGTAIGSLSGAAATTATMAWFGGGSVAAGGLGMAAAPFALSGIGAVATLPVFLMAGAVAAGKKEDMYSDNVSILENTINRAESLMEQDQNRLKKLDITFDEVTLQLIQDTTLFEFFSSGRDDPDFPTAETTKAANVLWLTMQKATEAILEAKPRTNPPNLYLSKPEEIIEVTAKPIDSTTIAVSWVDGNDVDAEVIEYEVWAKNGILSGFMNIKNTPITTFRHNDLEPNTQYGYQVTAVNNIGVSKRSKAVSAKTLP